MRLKESEIRQLIREGLFGSDTPDPGDIKREIRKSLPPSVIDKMESNIQRIKLGNHLRFYRWFKDEFGALADTRFRIDPGLLGTLAGGVAKDYVLIGKKPDPEDARVVKELMDAAAAVPDVTGISWFMGTCYRGMVMPALRFIKGVDASAFEESKEEPGWFSDPIGRFRGETTLYPMVSNYYDFAKRKQQDFFISFSTKKSTARSFTEEDHAYGFWARAAEETGRENVEVVNPLFECRPLGAGAILDPRVRAKTIDREMNEGLNEVLGCPYIDKSIQIDRIFIPYESLEKSIEKFGRGKLKSYREKLSERRIQTYIAGEDLVIDRRDITYM